MSECERTAEGFYRLIVGRVQDLVPCPRGEIIAMAIEYMDFTRVAVGERCADEHGIDVGDDSSTEKTGTLGWDDRRRYRLSGAKRHGDRQPGEKDRGAELRAECSRCHR